MQVVVTMAGEGSRFRHAGYAEPKHRIIVREKTLFEWSMESLRSFFHYPFVFVHRGDRSEQEWIAEKARDLGIQSVDCIRLEALTAGQAASVHASLPLLSKNSGLVIYNIDTYVEPHVLNPGDIRGHGWIPVFRAIGSHWSFVKTDPLGRVIEIREKDAISNLATIGLYYFDSASLFQDCYEHFDYRTEKEHFVAPLYGSLISDPASSVYAHEIPSSVVHPLGTPVEVEHFSRSASPR